MIAPKHNPFRAQRLDAVRYRLQSGTWAQLDAKLAAMRYRAAIVGPHGSGKTTLLDALENRLVLQGFSVVRAVQARDEPAATRDELAMFTATLRASDVLIYDGADHLPMLRWRQLRRATRSIAGLIVTSHTRRLLPTLMRTHTTPALLRELIVDLLDGDARPDIVRACDALYATHRGNLRDALRACYHIAAGLGRG